MNLGCGRITVEHGALYPGLFRLVRQGLLKTKWGVSDANPRAKFYNLTGMPNLS